MTKEAKITNEEDDNSNSGMVGALAFVINSSFVILAIHHLAGIFHPRVNTI